MKYVIQLEWIQTDALSAHMMSEICQQLTTVIPGMSAVSAMSNPVFGQKTEICLQAAHG